MIVPTRLFGRLSATVSWLLGRIVMLRAGVPALAYAPVHHLQSMWAHGLTRPHSIDVAASESIVMVDNTVDFTGYNADIVELVRDEVFEMERHVREICEREAKAEDLLSDDVRVNHRQRMLVGQALREPGSVFRIAAHQKASRVVYATARADLYGLVTLGLFDMRRAGRAFEFTPRPDLEALVTGGRTRY